MHLETVEVKVAVAAVGIERMVAAAAMAVAVGGSDDDGGGRRYGINRKLR